MESGEYKAKTQFYTSEQKIIHTLLSDFDSKLGQAYFGAIHTLYQGAYPDRMVHFAHSLRETIDLLAKMPMTPKDRRKQVRESRSGMIKKHLNFTGRNTSFDDDGYLDLAYQCLSSVAHHERDLDEDVAWSELKKVGDIFKMLGTKPAISGPDMNTDQDHNTGEKYIKEEDNHWQGDDQA